MASDTSGRASARTRGPKDGSSVKELCALLNVSRETICDWRAKGWLVMSPSGYYYDAEATRAKVITMRGPRGGKAGGALANLPGNAAQASAIPNLTPEEAERIKDLPVNLLGLTPVDIAHRQKIAQMLQAETDAELSSAKLAQVHGDWVPAADALNIVQTGGRLVQDMFSAEIETAAIAMNGRWAIPLTDARMWLKEWTDDVLTRCANKANEVLG